MKIDNEIRKIMEELQKPFQEQEIEWRVGSTNADKTKGLALAYITNRAIQNRLDQVFGCMGWKNEFKEWKGNSQLCGISVFYNNEWITKWDGSDNSEVEQVKGGLSDSMKRCAYQWGIGRYLYELDSTWVKIKAVGKSYYLTETPKLPSWALPNSQDSKPTTNKDSDGKIHPTLSNGEKELPPSKPKEPIKTLTDTDRKVMKSAITKYLSTEQLKTITSFGGKNSPNTDVNTYTDKQISYLYGVALKEKTKKESEGLPL